MSDDLLIERLRAAVVAVFPELSDARFSLLAAGWDSHALDADGAWIFKFPRHAVAERGLRRESALLAHLRPRLTMPVPELTLQDGPPLFSRHAKLLGEQLTPERYAALPDAERDALAQTLADFHAELHAMTLADMRRVGAEAIKPWLPPDEILARIRPVVTPELIDYAEFAIEAWRQLPPDPHGKVYGFFDGHGWNMAFDTSTHRLNGIYDFADSGFGPMQQDFIYSTMISPDLTERLIAAYERRTSRQLDRARIALLSGVLRLSELAEYSDDMTNMPAMRENVARWAATARLSQ